MHLNELRIPRRKLHRKKEAYGDTILHRKLQKQQKIEDRFVLKFFNTIEKYQPANERAVDKFISRYYKYIEEFNYPGDYNPDITISQIFNFVRFLGADSEYNRVGRTMGLIKSKSEKLSGKDVERIRALKMDLWQNLLAPLKRIMRGTQSDKTHAGVSHVIDINERYNAMRIKYIKARWHARKLKRQLADIS